MARSRVNRVLVLREDIELPSIGKINKGEAILHRRGSAEIVDLPVYESDVLHALAASGGLPGVDAYNEVWVLRKGSLEPHAVVNIKDRVEGGEEPEQVLNQLPAHLEAIRIPLKLCPDQPIPFTPEDVLLQDGDVVYIQPRRDEYFYTGGLLSVDRFRCHVMKTLTSSKRLHSRMARLVVWVVRHRWLYFELAQVSVIYPTDTRTDPSQAAKR